MSDDVVNEEGGSEEPKQDFVFKKTPRASVAEQKVRQEQHAAAEPTISFKKTPRNAGVISPEMKAGIGGATESLMTTAGLGVGLTAISKIPVTPLPVKLAAGVTGYALGVYSGRETRSIMSENDIALMPEEFRSFPAAQRPGLVAAETYGYVAGGLPAPVVLARNQIFMTGNTMVGRMYNRLIKAFHDKPVRTTAVEAGIGVPVALAGGYAEKEHPDSDGVRALYEMTAGVASSVVPQLGYSYLQRTFNYVKDMIPLMPNKGKTVANEMVNNLINSEELDPALYVRMMNDVDPTLSGTPGQVTGDPAWIEFEKRLAQRYAAFGEESQSMHEHSMNVIGGLIKELSDLGNVEGMTASLTLKRAALAQQLNDELELVNRQAEEIVARLYDDVDESVNVNNLMSNVSVQIDDLLQDSISGGRKVENSLWNNIPDEITGTSDSFRAMVKQLKADEDDLPADALKYLSKLKEEDVTRIVDGTGKPIQRVTDVEPSVKLMQKFRSKLLEFARNNRKSEKYNEARVAGELAEAILEDIDRVPVAGDAHQIARSFSADLNETYRRSFVGTTQEIGRRGRKTPPELIATKTVAGGDVAVDLHMRDLTDATEFLAKHSETAGSALVSLSEENTRRMYGYQEKIVRLLTMSSAERDPATRSVTGLNIKKLRGFQEKWGKTLNRFPAVNDTINDAIKSEVSRKELAGVINGEINHLSKVNRLSKIIDDPTTVAKNAIYGNNPEKDLLELSAIVSADPVAAKGMTTVMLTAILKRSKQGEGTYNWGKFFNDLSEPVIYSKKNVLEIMEDGGLIDADHAKSLRKLETLYRNFAKYAKADVKPEPLSAGENIKRNAVRTLGLGVIVKTGMTPKDGALSLSLPHRISSGIDVLFNQLPAGKRDLALTELLVSKDILSKMVEETADVNEARKLANRLHIYMLTSGIMAVPDVVEETFAPEVSESAMSAL